MIDRASGTMVGNIGFHAPPPMEHLAEVAPDGVELGYSVHQPRRRQKYATEAIIALMHWAHTQHNQRCFVLTISPKNLPSTALAEVLGFTKCGSGCIHEWCEWGRGLLRGIEPGRQCSNTSESRIIRQSLFWALDQSGRIKTVKR